MTIYYEHVGLHVSSTSVFLFTYLYVHNSYMFTYVIELCCLCL